MAENDKRQAFSEPDARRVESPHDRQSSESRGEGEERQSPFARRSRNSTGSSLAGGSNTPVWGALASRRKNGHLIPLIAAAVLLLIAGLVYVYWYQNPQKVASDAVVHALHAKSATYTGTITTTGLNKMVVTLYGGVVTDGGTVNAKRAYQAGGKAYTLDGNGILDKKNDLYFKVQNIDSLVNNYRRAIPADSRAMFDQIIDKIDDKWVKVSSSDLKNFNPDLVKTQECFSDALKEMQNDETVRTELISTYQKHPFITIDRTLGAKNGSLGYSLKSDSKVEESFNQAFKNTAYYKTLVKCDSRLASKNGDQTKGITDTLINKGTTEIWISRWSHQITKVTFKQEDTKSTTNVSLEPKFNHAVAIVTPKQSTTAQQLQQDIQSLLQSGRSATAAPAAP
jgi:hypothetical protein